MYPPPGICSILRRCPVNVSDLPEVALLILKVPERERDLSRSPRQHGKALGREQRLISELLVPSLLHLMWSLQTFPPVTST